MGSLIYSMILGVVTGFYQIGVGVAFVLLGVIGIFTGLIRKKPVALGYMLLFCIIWMGALSINIMGIVQPETLTTFKNEFAVGTLTIKSGYEWFLGGLVFTIVCCTPCLCISICNCATMKNLEQYNQYKKKKKQEKNQRKQSIKPLIERLERNDLTNQNQSSSINSSHNSGNINNRKVSSLKPMNQLQEHNSDSHTSED